MLQDITSPFYSWIRGGLLVLFVYHFIIYVQNRDVLHRYYSIYLFCLTVYLVRDAFTNETVQYYYQYISFSIQYIGYAYFIHFCRSLVNTKQNFPKLDKGAVNLSKGLLVLAFFLVVIQFLWGYEVQKLAVAWSVPFTSFCAFYIFFVVSKKKSKQVFYLLLGSILFLILANISSVKMVKGELYLIDFKVHRMFYYFIGAIIQSTIFAILIGNYFREIIEQKNRVEIHLLKQRNQISELKLIALKSQMNPHFLFNSLNSINNFVIQNKVDKASNYITKFSLLIRKVLRATNKNSISLKEELDVLSIYIKLEQMRLKNSFVFEKEIDDNINIQELKVVPLFLQPFVENAIWHGLSLKKGDNKLILSVQLEKKDIVVKVVDNGIGLNASQRKKDKQLLNKKSYGINLVKERLELMYGQEIKVDIEDISDEKATGTQVFICFPYNL